MRGVAFALLPFAALAQNPPPPVEDDPPPADEGAPPDDALWGKIGATDKTPDVPPGDDGTDEPAPPVCATSPVRVGNGIPGPRDGYRYSTIDGMYFRIDIASGRVWVRYYKVCTYADGSSRAEYIWVTEVDPDPRVLIPGTVDDATEKVYAPAPEMSPATQGVVNLGMWLAVQDQGQVSAEASASASTWARTTASLRETSFDFGNGDVVTCVGAGDPIPESAKSSIEASPVCGYTFTDNNGGVPFRVTITSTWSVVSTTSSGLSVNQPDLVLSTSFDYRVVEVQTVGQSG